MTSPSDPTPSRDDAGQPPASPYGQPAPPVEGGYGVAPAGGPQIASMVDRLVARIIDAVVLGVVGLILVIPAIGALVGSADTVTGEPSGGAITGFFVVLAVFVVITLAYEVVFIAVRGQTIGKQVMKITVRREADGALPDWGPSFLRWLVPIAAGVVTSCIGGVGQLVVYISPFFDNSGRNQGWHDKVAKTLVVKG